MQIEAALERYVLQLEADGRSSHTVAQSRRHVRMFGAWLASAGKSGEIEAVTHETVAAFLASERVRMRADGGPRKASSGNAVRSSLRGFLSYTHAVNITSTNPGQLIRRATCPPSRPKSLSESDQAKLVAALETARTPAERRDRVLFTVLLRCGLRVGSAVALDIEDVDLGAGEIALRRTKRGGDDAVVVPDDVVALLRELIGQRRAGPLFLGSHGGRLGTRHVRRRLARWAEVAGINGRVFPHALRHSLAQRLYDRTGDLLLVARVLGHKSILSTTAYAHASKAAVRRAISA